MSCRDADIGRNVLCNLERRGEDLTGRNDLAEEVIVQPVGGRVDGAGAEEVHGLAGPDEPRQVKAAAGLHAEAAPREDEAALGVAAGDADGGGQRHGHADADGGAVDGGNDGLGAALHGQRDLAARVAVVCDVGRATVRGVEVHARAKEAVGGVGGGEHDGAHARVCGQGVVGCDERVGHAVCEGVSVCGPVELDDDYRCHGGGRLRVVGEDEVRDGPGVVAFWG